MELVINPDKRLRQKARKLKLTEISTPEIQKFTKELTKTMKEKDGVGLAAPQVGKSIRIISVDTENGPICFINPIILWKSIRKELGEEGCLSVPGIFGLVKRNRSLTLSFYDTTGKKNILKAKGLFARVLQHEIDHLNGILFIDKMVKETFTKK